MVLSRLSHDLHTRSRQAEEMDAPGLEPACHERALQGLARINILSLAAGRAWTRIKDLPRSPGAPLRVLDVACGGGDIAVALKARAEKAGIPVDMEGCDLSPVALEVARKRANRRGLDIRFFQHDATEKRLPAGYDLVCSSLFLHHLSTGEASIFLERLAAAGTHFLSKTSSERGWDTSWRWPG